MIFTCEVANYERDNTAIRDVMMHINPTVVLLQRCATRNKTLTMIKYLAQDTDNLAEEIRQRDEVHVGVDENTMDHIEGEGEREEESAAKQQVKSKVVVKAPVIPVALGASCLEEVERQYALDAQRGVLRAMCLGPVSFPNLFTCTFDLLHTRECNAYVTIDSFDADHMRGLGKFVKKYKRPAPAILAKILMELGAIVCIDRALMDEETFYSAILRLVHPFTHLQVGYQDFAGRETPAPAPAAASVHVSHAMCPVSHVVVEGSMIMLWCISSPRMCLTV